MDTTKICVVIPCFNEETTIAALVRKVRTYVPSVCVVDDGSGDNTAAEAAGAGAKIIRCEKNLGKGSAVQRGLAFAAGDGFQWAVLMDGDGQHAPSDIPGFLKTAHQTGAPLIVGNRMHDSAGIPWLRRQVNRWMSWRLSTVVGQNWPDSQCGFRLVCLDAWSRLQLRTRRFQIESEMLLAFHGAGHRIEFVPVQVICAQRKSRIQPVVDTWRWFAWWRLARVEARLWNRE